MYINKSCNIVKKHGIISIRIESSLGKFLFCFNWIAVVNKVIFFVKYNKTIIHVFTSTK